ncbi:MAG: ribosome small subunit-dependent GTPase A [Marinifilaceae bacterium]|jgi:ribosome biogenesis GTPase|nr:ribosome small subunit-dependent GTPase A [Marinifilaceae bacterium]
MIKEVNIPADIKLICDIENIARVISVHKDRYTIQSINSVLHAEITGKLRFSAESSEDLPTVGDWVEMMTFDEDMAIIISLFPRKTSLQRKAVGRVSQAQIIAANVDYCFVVMSLDDNYNINRLERYISLILGCSIQPIIILSKTDLNLNAQIFENQLVDRFPNIEIISSSNMNRISFNKILYLLKPNKTYCFIGSSGVGKSTIINHLIGSNLMNTQAVSESNNKGRHTTSHRQLFFMSNDAMIIDTPGMRELGMTNITHGINLSFSRISELSRFCKYDDCSHEYEPDCAVIKALSDGVLSIKEYDNYQKLRKEQAYYNETSLDRKRKGKDLAKKIKEVKMNIKSNKFQ